MEKLKLKKIIDFYGSENQKNKLIEELGELLIELSKNKAGKQNQRKLAEEMADVHILIEQLIMKENMEEEYKRVRNYKINRQIMRMGRGK